MRAHTLSVSERGTTPALALRSIHISSVRAEICIHGKRVYVDHQLQFLLSEYMSLRVYEFKVYVEHLSIRVYVDHQLQFLLSEYMKFRVYEFKGICRISEYSKYMSNISV